MTLEDNYGRTFKYIRVSLTDRCNLYCLYCRKDGVENFPKREILTLEEIEFLVKFFNRNFGIEKVRLTGGEPLLRRGIDFLIQKLSEFPLKLNITTNGVLLDGFSKLLAECKVGVNVSLDTLNPDKFEKISGGNHLARVIHGIDTALEYGIKLKINTVLLRGINDSEIFDLIEFANSRKVEIRFIEFMPFTPAWNSYFISEDEVRGKIEKRYKLSFLGFSGTASVYMLENGAKVGFISTVSKPFCRSCSRLRLTADGRIVLCMFDKFSYSIKEFLRPKVREKELLDFMMNIVKRKPEGFIALKERRANFDMIKLGG